MDSSPNLNGDFTNETVISTPTPRASSTTQKPPTTKRVRLNKIPLVYSPNTPEELPSSAESLGILRVDNSGLDVNCQNVRHSQVTNEKLQQQRTLASNILQKTLGLPSRYLKFSDTINNSSGATACNSTINETDLLQASQSCASDISTPRSSRTSDASDISRISLGRASQCSNTSMSKSIAQFSQQIRNSDLSLAELCDQFRRNNSISGNFSQFGCGEESFVPGELAAQKIIERELSWRRERDVLGDNHLRSDSFSQMDWSNQENSMSVAEFFQKKSELAELCLKDSPERNMAPVPLIDESVTFESISINESLAKSKSGDESVLSITDMEEAISVSDDTARIADYIGRAIKKDLPQRATEAEVFRNTIKDDFKENQEPRHFQIHSTPIVHFKEPRAVLKEGIVFDNSSEKSNTSLRTVSSLESLHNGKLPIETNRIELVWGCLRVGKKKSQKFILRNKSHNKLRLQISSSHINFRILSDHSESDSVSVLPILMYPSESHSVTVTFTPTSIGAVVGKLNFSPISTDLQLQQTKRQQIMLYGYGGHSKIQVENVLKDTNMKMWLSLGKLNHQSRISQQFNLRNVGTLAAFAFINLGSKALCGSSKVTISPTQLVLQPNEQTAITVTYIPTKEDANHLFMMSPNQIIDIGFVQIVTGEEPVRGRIRRLCRKLKQESGIVANPLIEQLSNKFPNEKMPPDLGRFTETVGCVKDLMQTFDSKEIILTVEKDSDSTLLGQICGIDESSMFHSLSEGVVTVLANKTLMSSCTVEPSKLVLTPPGKTEDCILITSQNAAPLQFEIGVTPSDGLQVTPSEGILPPGEMTFIRISCHTPKLPQQVFKICVYVDDEMFEVEVKVIVMKFTSK